MPNIGERKHINSEVDKNKDEEKYTQERSN
jgi:hypothetical protein